LPETSTAFDMAAKQYKVGSKCGTGQVIASILGQSAVACVYTTTDNHLRWEYFKDRGALPKALKPAISRFDAQMARIRELSNVKDHKPLFELLGKSLFSALDSGLAESVSSYFRPVERMIGDHMRPKAAAKRKRGTRRVFIVHGRDDGAKEGLARFLAQIELKPVILAEQATGGNTIIEKFEAHAADVDFVVVLLTPDDAGGLNDGSGKLNPRARQNVIFELGYFCGALGRSRVAALHKGGVELPSDYQGVVYIAMDDAAAWKLHLAREIRNAGLAVDLNKA
jgi:predicted nucleotide-binding protein